MPLPIALTVITIRNNCKMFQLESDKKKRNDRGWFSDKNLSQELFFLIYFPLISHTFPVCLYGISNFKIVYWVRLLTGNMIMHIKDRKADLSDLSNVISNIICYKDKTRVRKSEKSNLKALVMKGPFQIR